MGSSLVVHQGGGGLGGLNGQGEAGLLGWGCSRSSFVLVGMALSAVSSVSSPSVWGLLTSTLASRASYLRDSLVISKLGACSSKPSSSCGFEVVAGPSGGVLVMPLCV